MRHCASIVSSRPNSSLLPRIASPRIRWYGGMSDPGALRRGEFDIVASHPFSGMLHPQTHSNTDVRASRARR